MTDGWGWSNRLPAVWRLIAAVQLTGNRLKQTTPRLCRFDFCRRWTQKSSFCVHLHLVPVRLRSREFSRISQIALATAERSHQIDQPELAF